MSQSRDRQLRATNGRQQMQQTTCADARLFDLVGARQKCHFRTRAPQQKCRLFAHLVGARQQDRRGSRACRFEVVPSKFKV
jgi:hypothetical protein